MFFVSSFEVSTCLSYVFLLAAFTFHIYRFYSICRCCVFYYLFLLYFVLYAILMFVFLNSLVTVLVYFHMYVNVVHFCFSVVLGVRKYCCDRQHPQIL
jgi:hypothetical protein